jgi:hypothetical protein
MAPIANNPKIHTHKYIGGAPLRKRRNSIILLLNIITPRTAKTHKNKMKLIWLLYHINNTNGEINQRVNTRETILF